MARHLSTHHMHHLQLADVSHHSITIKPVRPQTRITCRYNNNNDSFEGNKFPQSSTEIQLNRDFERLLAETMRQTQGTWGDVGNWTEVEEAWVLKPRSLRPKAVLHFIGGIFVGAAPQLTYRYFLERLSEQGVLVVATPYASGFDHFFTADEVQLKFEKCCQVLHETVKELPVFGIGHSLGSVIHLLIGSRYAVKRSGNILIAFNNKAEMTIKQIQNLSPPLVKQALPLLEQLPPLYMDLIKGREEFSPTPEETRQLIKSYYGISSNLLIKFKDDALDETTALA